jgi:hypothetical protein
MLDEERIFGKWYDGACEPQEPSYNACGDSGAGERGRYGQGRKQKLHRRHQAHMRRFQDDLRSRGMAAPRDAGVSPKIIPNELPSLFQSRSPDASLMPPEERLLAREHGIHQAQLREVRDLLVFIFLN